MKLALFLFPTSPLLQSCNHSLQLFVHFFKTPQFCITNQYQIITLTSVRYYKKLIYSAVSQQFTVR